MAACEFFALLILLKLFRPGSDTSPAYTNQLAQAYQGPSPIYTGVGADEYVAMVAQVPSPLK
jgi:hypothetical protein